MSAYYWLFFLAIASFAPFSALWFDSKNISSAISGAIFAAPSIATVLLTISIGKWADRLRDWRRAIIVCNWIVLIAVCWILVGQGPWHLLFIWTVSGLFTRAAGPIMDAAALNSTQKSGADYGRIRAFGSIGFIVGVVLAGWLFDHFGIAWFVSVILISAFIRVVAAHMLPPFRLDKPLVNTAVVASAGLASLRHPGILFVLVGSALINGSHGFVNAFSVMHWSNVGISTGIASALWSIGVIAEVALMWKFKSVAKRFSARKCLLFASAVGVARWFLTSTDPGLLQLFLLQALHSITFGLTLLATVNFIAKRVPEDHAARAQSVYNMMMTLCIGLSIWSSGWLYSQFAGQTYWAMAMLALVGGGCVALSFCSDLDDPVHAA